jgi:N-methylhydantoinase B
MTTSELSSDAQPYTIDLSRFDDRTKYEPMRMMEWPRDDEAWPRINQLKDQLDSLTVDVIGGALEWAVEEGEAVVERMARSSVIREQHDYRASINTLDCDNVTTVSWAATADPIRNLYPVEDIRPGDVFLYNDVHGSCATIGHLPDYCVAIPIFADGRIIGFSQIFGHVTDVGGAVPGSWPVSSKSIFEEGTICPVIKLYDAGKLNVDAQRIILRNSRFPGELKGDIDAFIACARLMEKRVLDLVDQYGADTVEAAFYAIMDRCAHDVRTHALPNIPDGEYVGEDFIENDGVSDAPIKIKYTILKDKDHLVIDAGGTGPTAEGPVNWAMDGRHYIKWLGAFLASEAPGGLSVNEGLARVMLMRIPPDTVLTARHPAPVVDRMECMLVMIGAYNAAMAKAHKGKVIAGSMNIQVYQIYGHDDDGQEYLYREIFGAGSGARPWADGTDTVDLVPNSKNLPAEFIEQRYPVQVERVGLFPDSGGPGKYRGGLGYLKDIRCLADGFLSITAYRTVFGPFGVNGGKAGLPGLCYINPGTPDEVVLKYRKQMLPVKKGDVVRITTPGGGGWGDPLERSPEAVCLDVQRQLVSRASAADDYGVVLVDADDPRHPLTVDETATAELRARMRTNRPPLKLIDRGPAFNKMVEDGLITVSDFDDLAFDDEGNQVG